MTQEKLEATTTDEIFTLTRKVSQFRSAILQTNTSFTVAVTCVALRHQGATFLRVLSIAKKMICLTLVVGVGVGRGGASLTGLGSAPGGRHWCPRKRNVTPAV